MKKINFKKGCIGSAIRPVTTALLCGSLLLCSFKYVETKGELDEAQSKIVQYESSLKNQKKENEYLEIHLDGVQKNQMDLISQNDILLKDKATLNQKLKDETAKVSKLKLKQTELQAQLRKK